MKKKWIFISLLAALAVLCALAGCTPRTIGPAVPSPGPTEDAEEQAYQAAKNFSVQFSPRQAELRDCRIAEWAGTASGVVVGYMDSRTSHAKYTVQAPASARYLVRVRCQSDVLTNYSLFVNETEELPLGFGDGTFRTAELAVWLNEGENTLKVRNPQGQGYSCVLDTVEVRGFAEPEEVASSLSVPALTEGDTALRLPAYPGFTVQVESSTEPDLVGTDGSVHMQSYESAVPRDAVLTIKAERNGRSAATVVRVRVPVLYPSAEEIAAQIQGAENGKLIERGRTTLPWPTCYEGQTVLMSASSDTALLSLDGVVSARGQDASVTVRYEVAKPDGSRAETGDIIYTVEGLGYDPEATFMNPLGEGEDPYVSYIDGWYYHIQAQHGPAQAHLEMIRSRSFLDFSEQGFTTVYTFQPYASGVWNCSEIWGPFPLMKWTDGHYYIYYAADNGDNNNHRQGVLRSVTGDPMGAYEDLGMVNTGDAEENPEPTVFNTVWAIGATTFQAEGESYLVWSGWRSNYDQFPQRTYIAKIHAPNRVGARVELSSPLLGWEGQAEGTPLMEGQAVTCVGGRYVMLYSANASWAGRYRLGMLVYEDTNAGGFLNPDNWVKRPEAVFEATDQVESPGGPCLISTPDGSEWWLLYHSSMYFGSGWTRYVSAKPVRLDGEGLPVLDDPLPFYAPMRNPGGDAFRQAGLSIVQAEDALLSNGLAVTKDRKASGGKYVALAAAGDKMTFRFRTEKEGLYRIVIRYATRTDDTRHVLRVNGKVRQLDPYRYYGYDNFFTAEATGLFGEGENTVELEFLSGYDVKCDFIGICYAGE